MLAVRQPLSEPTWEKPSLMVFDAAPVPPVLPELLGELLAHASSVVPKAPAAAIAAEPLNRLLLAIIAYSSENVSANKSWEPAAGVGQRDGAAPVDGRLAWYLAVRVTLVRECGQWLSARISAKRSMFASQPECVAHRGVASWGVDYLKYESGRAQ